MHRPIYLDYAATTPVDSTVIEVMNQCLGEEGDFGNPASNTHIYGFQARERVENAREQVANILNATADEIVFTSGATESNNMAITGLVNLLNTKHVITLATEHKAVIDPCKALQAQGVEVTLLKPQANGLLDLGDLAAAITPETGLVSIMMVNNETGVIQDIEAIAKLVKANNIYLHVDAVQAVGKLPIDVQSLPVDLLSVSAHKVYGPKGVGALYVRRKPRVKIKPIIHGGGHEHGFRSGTLATHQIAGMGKAFELAQSLMTEEVARIQSLKTTFWEGVQSLPGVSLNGDWDHSVCGIINVQFEGIDSEALIMAMDKIAVSAGSACTSATVESSHVLSAMGMSDKAAHSSIRFSFGRYTSEADVQVAIDQVVEHVGHLRSLSPVSS